MNVNSALQSLNRGINVNSTLQNITTAELMFILRYKILNRGINVNSAFHLLNESSPHVWGFIGRIYMKTHKQDLEHLWGVIYFNIK